MLLVGGLGSRRVDASKKVGCKVGQAVDGGSKIKVRCLLDEVFQCFGRAGARSGLPVDAQDEAFLGIGRDVKTDINTLLCGYLWPIVDVCEQIEEAAARNVSRVSRN